MKLFLEKRLDGTYYFRQTKIVSGKQISKRFSLKTRHKKEAQFLAIQILAKLQMDKIKKFDVELDSTGNLKKVNVDGNNPDDIKAFMQFQEQLEASRAFKHQRELELLQFQQQQKQQQFEKTFDSKKLDLYSELNTTLNKGETVKYLVNKYLNEIKVTPGVHYKYTRVLNKFADFACIQEHIFFEQIDRKLVAAFISHLRTNEKKEDKTIKNMLGVLSTFFNFQISVGETKNPNPFTGHKLKAEEEKREPFTIDELNAIFSSDFVKQNEQNKFILLLLLTTGARPNEICQLMASDIYEAVDEATKQKLYVIDIDKKEVTQSLKNKSSKRKIYLHQLLIDSGFLVYLSTRKHKMLFDLTKPTRKNFSVFFSEKFTDLLRDELKIKEKVLYCLRHTANNRLKQNMIPQEVREDLIGHSSTGTNAKIYTQKLAPMALKKLTEEILYFREVASLKPCDTH